MRDASIRICGMGGQGVIMSGLVLGRAVSIYEDRWSTMIQSFGPEARGSTCSAQVLVADVPIAFPYVRRADIFMAFSQAGYDRYIDELGEGGVLIYESDLIVPDRRVPDQVRRIGVPASRMVRDAFGTAVMFNMVMIGQLVAATGLVSAPAVQQSIVTSVPEGTTEMNCAAFDLGFQLRRPDRVPDGQ